MNKKARPLIQPANIENVSVFPRNIAVTAISVPSVAEIRTIVAATKLTFNNFMPLVPVA